MSVRRMEFPACPDCGVAMRCGHTNDSAGILSVLLFSDVPGLANQRGVKRGHGVSSRDRRSIHDSGAYGSSRETLMSAQGTRPEWT